MNAPATQSQTAVATRNTFSAFMAGDGVKRKIGEIIAGKKTGRTSQNEITIFDSTGMALQDAAAAAIVYEKALQDGKGRIIDFAE